MDKKLKEFMDLLASDAPAPGGGSASALSAAMAASLMAMVCRLTLRNKKYQNAHCQMQELLKKVEEARHKLLELAQKDEDAFKQVMAAFKLLKVTEAEKEKRRTAIDKAYRQAALVPLEVAQLGCNLLEFAQIHSEQINMNAITDWGVAALLAHAALNGALYNVNINLCSIKDDSFVHELAAVTKRLEERGEELNRELRQNFNSKIKAG